MHVDLVSLRLFVSVAEELNMTRAAQREHLVLPAASKRLKELEENAGTQLLYRHAPVNSDAGAWLIEHGENPRDLNV